MSLRIGHSAQQYPELRTIIGKVEGCEYQLCRDYYGLVRRLVGTFGNRSSARAFNWEFCFRDFGINNVDCIHLFNGINYSNTPWVVTFETILPRFRVVLDHRDDPDQLQYSETVIEALELLASTYCKSIIALSKSAFDIQLDFLTNFPDLKTRIAPKATILHPPQKALLQDASNIIYPYEASNKICFMLVGHQFFSKGGVQIINAMHSVRKDTGVDLRLCVVSALKPDQYVTMSNISDVNWVREFIAENSDWIEYYESLPNERVLEKIHSSDVGLLPSHAETYGYTVLEFQACARPVITTNIRAFPEINNDDCGWVIPVAKRTVGGEAFYQTNEQREQLRSSIATGLENVIREISRNPESIRAKGAKAIERIRCEHDPILYGKKLSSIYQNSI